MADNQQPASAPTRQYSGPEDIYDELVGDNENSWLFGLLAFAVVEEQRIEWAKHQVQHKGGIPTPEEIKAWYEQQPPGVLLRAKGTAENTLRIYSEEVLEQVDGDIRKEVEEGVILHAIQDVKRFWPQFGVNLAGGFIASLLFALLLVALATIILNEDAQNTLGRKIGTQTQVIEDGEK